MQDNSLIDTIPDLSILRQRKTQSTLNTRSVIPPLHVVLVSSRLDPVMCETSLVTGSKLDLPLRLVGLTNNALQSTGKNSKIYGARRFLEDVPDWDVVMLTDSYDTLFQQSDEHIVNLFLEKARNNGTAIILSAETNCWVRVHLFSPFFLPYVNQLLNKF